MTLTQRLIAADSRITSRDLIAQRLAMLHKRLANLYCEIHRNVDETIRAELYKHVGRNQKRIANLYRLVVDAQPTT